MVAIRGYVVACVAIAACKSAENNKVDNPTTTGAAALDLPRVDEDRAVADVAKVPRPVAVAWTGAFPTGKRTPAPTIDAARLALGEDTATTGASDDPPPPPPDDLPDDGRDESGGTGTAMALDEGKMGKKDSDRAEGQYKMKKVAEDPRLARQQAIDEARRAGILGSARHGGSIAGRRYRDPALPSLPIAGLRLDRAIIVAAAPSAPALQLARIIVDETGAIAVSNRGKLAVLARGYGIGRDQALGDEPTAWIVKA